MPYDPKNPFAGLSGIQTEKDLLNEQLQMALALRGRSMGNYTTGIGGGLGALGTLGNSIASILRERKAEKGLADVREREAGALTAAQERLSAAPAPNYSQLLELPDGQDPTQLLAVLRGQEQARQAALKELEATGYAPLLTQAQAARGELAQGQKTAADVLLRHRDRTNKLADTAAAQAAALEKEQREQGFTLKRDSLQNAAAERRARIIAAGQAEARADRVADRRAAAEAAAATKAEEKLEKDVDALSKRMEDVPALRNDLATLVKMAGEKDIPGVGMVAGRLPGFLLSDDGVRNRQAMRGIVGRLIKEQSGSAATEAEIDRKMEELGFGGTEDQHRLGLERLTGNVRDAVRAKEAGAKPEAVKLARERGLVTSEDIPQYQAKPGAAAPAPIRRTDPRTGETRVWNGSDWVKE